MTYVVNENCIKCKFTDCVEVCPVDCFYEGENMLVINPEECIDCGVCEPECPVDAIISDTEDKDGKWLKINTEFSNEWPNITLKKDPPVDAEKYENEDDKYNKFFSKKPKETIFIPKGAIHRIQNLGNQTVRIMEAQLGSILKETDIVRYEDIYGRAN